MKHAYRMRGKRIIYQQQSLFDMLEEKEGKEKLRGMKRKGVAMIKEPKNLSEEEKMRLRAERMINRMFIRLGLPLHMMGSVILCEAILLVLEKPDLVYHLMHELYPALADLFESNVPCIERDLRTMITVSWEKGIFREKVHMLGAGVGQQNNKPTKGEMIAVLAERVRFELYAKL